MPSGRRGRVCRGCKQVFPSKEDLSRGGLCGPCGVKLVNRNVSAMQAKSGPEWERWQEGMVRAAGRASGGAVPRTYRTKRGKKSA